MNATTQTLTRAVSKREREAATCSKPFVRQMPPSPGFSSPDDSTALDSFLRALNHSNDSQTMLLSLFDLLKAYQLKPAIQLCLRGLDLTISENGENHPFDVVVIKHLRGMGRILEFSKRAAYNFEYLSVVINRLPLDDPERCNRLRDSVIIAAGCTNARIRFLQEKSGTAGLLRTVQKPLP